MSSTDSKLSRRATHSGSWYTCNAKELSSQLDRWLAEAGKSVHGPARAIIAPHAGYQYCGACAAHAYKEIHAPSVKRIFILGPSHHVRLSGCALSSAKYYKTPLYDLRIDEDIYRKLDASCLFDQMSLSTDEDEHSIEMHLPYIAKVMESRQEEFTIVPILVGSLTPEKEAQYGQLLAGYLADPDNVFVVSSDFCHWGSRFHYQFYDKSWGSIYQSITKLDEMGMKCIESLSPSSFTSYLRKYSNTVCGRHPIGVLLNAIHTIQKTSTTGGEDGNGKMSLKFLNYAQSSECLHMGDSSVSYAAASLAFTDASSS